jgi:hypothetical protein
MNPSLESLGSAASNSAAVDSLRDLFHRRTKLSRNTPPSTLKERLDQLARLPATIADNETRLEAAISADFGHRCAIETAIAETLLVLGAAAAIHVVRGRQVCGGYA